MTKRIFSMLLLTVMSFLVGFTDVKAASVPSQIKVSSTGKIDYGGGYYFPVKYMSDGTLAYCVEFDDRFPMGITMANPKKVDAGLAYIIANGYKGTKSDVNNYEKMKQYYITQLAIYTYLDQAEPANKNAVQNAVWKLVNGARAAKNTNTQALNVSLSIPSTTMKLTSDKKYFISEAITVKSNYSNVSFQTAVSQNVGATLVNSNGDAVKTVKNGDVVYIKVPESIISAGQSVTLSMAIQGAKSTKNAYVYQPTQSAYQNIIPGIVFPTTEVAKASLKVSAKKAAIPTKLKVSKQDITNNKELPGAKLVIKDAAGTIKASWTSSTTPFIITGLKAGDYKLCETEAPAGYILKKECINFTLKADGNIKSVVMTNEKQETKVKVSKKDITNDNELPGAKLEIRDLNDNVKISWTSSTSPKQITGIKPGNYKLCETIAPDGYELETQCINFTIKEDGTPTTVVMYNKPTPKTTRVKISKQDITNNKELPGAKLEIKDLNGNVKISWTSGTTAKEITGLKEGSYYLCETVAPEGYELETQCVKFQVYANGEASTVVMYNAPKKVTKLSVLKIDSETKKPLAGATLVLKDLNGKVVKEWITKDTAEDFTGIEEGTYTVEEIKAPNGYVLNTTPVKVTLKANNEVTKIEFKNTKEEVKETKLAILKIDSETKKPLAGATLVLKNSNGKVVKEWITKDSAENITGIEEGTYTVEEIKAPNGYVLNNNPVKVTLKADNSLTNVVFENTKQKEEVKKTNLSILKVDSETKKPLAGATLVLKNSNGALVETWVTTTNPKVFETLPAGNYTVEETKAPEGYVLSTEKVSVKLEANNKTTEVTFINKKEVTKLKISKQDITNKKELPGATLELKDESGKLIETWVSTNEPKYFEGLNSGKYTLCEKIAPEGYELETECINFELKANGVEKVVTMYNAPIKEVTKVTISKQDITNKEELPGATLVIKDSEGKVVETWVSTNKPHYIEGLESGKYTLCETIAPAGYMLATECVSFELTDGKMEKVVIYNTPKKEEIKPSKVKISKQDIATKTELPGATLIIKDSQGKEIKRWVSTNEAQYFELEAGTYTLEEIQAPDGYILSTEVIEFTVNEDKTVDKEVIMYNTKAVDVPITASSVSILVYIIGLLGVIYGFKTVFTNAKL